MYSWSISIILQYFTEPTQMYVFKFLNKYL